MVKRMGMMIGLKPERIAEYKALHAAPWPEMNAALTAANIRNYSIFLKEPENLLFGYWEYLGKDFEADMAALGAKDVTKRWLSLTDPCQQPLATARQGEWWSFLQNVFHLD
jgi:L-rhamnose mutarotase